jgi:hypothetical protein
MVALHGFLRLLCDCFLTILEGSKKMRGGAKTADTLFESCANYLEKKRPGKVGKKKTTPVSNETSELNI